MAEVVEALLNHKVTPENITLWLQDVSNDQVPAFLQDLQHCQAEFVPVFLNLLREQANSLLLSHQVASSSTSGNNSGNHHVAVSRLQQFPIGAVKYVSPRKVATFCQPLFGTGGRGGGGRLNFSAVAAAPARASLQVSSQVANKSCSIQEPSAAAYDLDQLLLQDTCETSMSKSQQAYPKPPKMVSPHERGVRDPTNTSTGNHGTANTDGFPWAQQTQQAGTGNHTFTPLATKSSRSMRLSTSTPRLLASTPKNSSGPVAGRRSVGEELVAASTSYDSRPANWNRRLSTEGSFGHAGDLTDTSKTSLHHSHNSNHHNSFSSKHSYDVKPSEYRNSLSDYVVSNNSMNKKSANRKKNNAATSNLSNSGTGSFLQNSSVNHSGNWDNRNRVSLDISDNDTFPPMSTSKTDKNPKKKRIKPTRVTPTRAPLSREVNSAFTEAEEQQPASVKQPLSQIEENSVFSVSKDSSDSGLDQERKMLRQLKAKMKTNTTTAHSIKDSSACNLPESEETPVRTSILNKGKTPVKEMLVSQDNSQDHLLCSPELVSNVDLLDNLSRVYADLVLYNYVPSLMMELYFAFQLLTARGCMTIAPQSHSHHSGGGNSSQTWFLGSLANCVYFASRFLSRISSILQLLDPSLLRLLVENKRLQAFAPQLQLRLVVVVGTSPAQPSPKQPPRSPIKGVAYQVDTDNRTNFPDNTTFHIFRKQRDIFYELLREWERGHQSPDWNLSCSLGHKIRSLLDLGPDPANVAHLSRLFASQLITMCETGHMTPWKPQEGGASGVLSLLQRQHPEKFERLQQRLVAPSRSTGGPVPPPSFPGVQQFFRGFLLEAYNPTFNTHLEDNIVAKLLDLLGASENGEAPSSRRSGRTSVSLMLRRVGVLSKFLGVLWFSAYISPLPLPQPALAQQVALRSKLYPRLSLCAMLRRCAARGQLVAGAVSCVQLLSLSDAAALHTTHLQTAVFVLIHIYKMALCNGLSSGTCCHRVREPAKKHSNEEWVHGKKHLQATHWPHQTRVSSDCTSSTQSCVDHCNPGAGAATDNNFSAATDRGSKATGNGAFSKRARTLNFTEDNDKLLVTNEESDCEIDNTISVQLCNRNEKDDLISNEDDTICFNKTSSKQDTSDAHVNDSESTKFISLTKSCNTTKTHLNNCKKSRSAAGVSSSCHSQHTNAEMSLSKGNCKKNLNIDHQHQNTKNDRLHYTSSISSHASGNVIGGSSEGDVMMLHENVNQKLKQELSKTVFSGEVSLFIRLLLGWLFDLPVFPDGLFHTDPHQAEIDYEEYIKTIELLNTFYSNPCLYCCRKSSAFGKAGMEGDRKTSQDYSFSDGHSSAPFNDGSLATVRSVDNVCPAITAPLLPSATLSGTAAQLMTDDSAPSTLSHSKQSSKTPSKNGLITPLKVFKTPSRVSETTAHNKTQSSSNPAICQTPQRPLTDGNMSETTNASVSGKPSVAETPCKQATVSFSTVTPGKDLIGGASSSPCRNTSQFFTPDSRNNQGCRRRNVVTPCNSKLELSHMSVTDGYCTLDDSSNCSGTSSCPCCRDSCLAVSAHTEEVMKIHGEETEAHCCDLNNSRSGVCSLNSTPFKTPVAKRDFQKQDVIYEGLGLISPMVSITFQDTPDQRRGRDLTDAPVPPPASPSIPTNKLDEYMIVDHQLLQEWCPQLSELKALLLAYNIGGGLDGAASAAGVRKITPLSALPTTKTLPRQDKAAAAAAVTTNTSNTASVTAADSSRLLKQEEAAHKDIQHQLEESFFHQQPASVRETVQFVGEQLVANCVRQLRCSHIPEAVAANTDQLQQALETELMIGGANTTVQRTMEQVETIARARVLSATLKLRSQVENTCLKHLQQQLEQMPQLLLLLLPSDMSEQGVEVCSGVVRRSCMTRVGAWLAGHLEQATPPSLLAPIAVRIVRTVLKKMNVNETPDLHLSTSFEAAPINAVNSSGVSNNASVSQVQRDESSQKSELKHQSTRSSGILDRIPVQRSHSNDRTSDKIDTKSDLGLINNNPPNIVEQKVTKHTSGIEISERGKFVSETVIQTKTKTSDIVADTKKEKFELETKQSIVRSLPIFTSKAGGPKHVITSPAPSVLMAEMKNIARAIHSSATSGSAPPLLFRTITLSSSVGAGAKDGVFREREMRVAPHPLTSSVLLSLAEAASVCVRDRGDLTPPVLNGLKALTVDILAMISAVHPSLASDEVVSSFMRLWKTGAPLEAPPTLASTLLSPRIVHLVEEALRSNLTSPGECCLGLQMLAKRCVVEELLQKDVLHEKAVMLLQHCWSQDLLHGLSAMVQSLCEAEDENSVVSWLPWLCEEMENLPDLDD